MIKLFVGLGNPGAEYENTRHNAGFWWVDALADQWRLHFQPERAYQALVARANNVAGANGPVWLLKPMTFMNRSGVSVAGLARFFKIAPEEVLVVHDELDLQPGQAKLKFSGSAAGHNGLKDIHHMLGTAEYWRLRLGIGHPGVKAEVVNYVLKKPSAEHLEAIQRATDQSLKAVDAFVRGDMDAGLALVHAQPPRPKPPRKVMPLVAAAPLAPTAAPVTSGTPFTPFTSGTSGTSGTPLTSGTSGTSGTPITPATPVTPAPLTPLSPKASKP